MDSIKDAEGARAKCGGEGIGFERDCRSSWVGWWQRPPWEGGEKGGKKCFGAIEMLLADLGVWWW